jgi:class 3 adenylate cyclase/pimeloyl-ACP methyl ester carboxylesterase
MTATQVKRRLAAILAADVAGYTQSMERDTDGTVAAWTAARGNVIDPGIAKHSGRMVKHTGDGFVAEFQTVQDAVSCAVALQDGLIRNPLKFRMGIGLGDILDDGEDIHGEGVNIAARLEGLADPGGICVSGDVFNQVRHRLDYPFEDLGEQQVKNVSDPVHVYRIGAELTATPDAPLSAADQIIRFCTAADGVTIAYALVGSGPPLVIASNWLSHLELAWQRPARREMIEIFARDRTVIRYDQRGNGLSDLTVDDISFEALYGDLVAVVEDIGLDKFAILGMSQGAAVAAAYAARHPDRITHLVLQGGYAQGRRRRNSPGQLAESDAFITMIREGWGKSNPAYVQMFGSFFMPDASAEELAAFTELQRAVTTPENAARIQLAIDEIDVLDELKNITAPTLVLHGRHDARAPIAEGRRMAAAIRGARFVELDTRNHILLTKDPARQRFLDEITAFLATPST